ncbi:MAG: hypothetical protein J6U00_09685 [Ruminococcus sp.]|uniref:hypothetical protein n=1 Tax=Ruminococcus sp. TaxID=41978 RepID=UPI001B23ED0C|nr:hypothetical protein [Ruminococcus sp.]MBO7474248.1 hypothetical protein [Ruminococcus sp.]
MKKISTYLPSFIISVFLVFLIIASSAILLVDINVSASKIKKLAEKNALESKIYTEIEKYYTDKYNTTGIPAEVYMEAINDQYIKTFVEAYIDSAFEALNSNGLMNEVHPINTKLEENIDSFFNEFADKNNYQKDEKFDLKLKNTKDSAYITIGSFCDVYKFSTMSSKGVLSKLARIYSNRTYATALLLGSTLFMLILLVLINRKKKITAVYWIGISALISGIIGMIPSIYLIASRYYDSFSIKQPAVFTAFTSAMYKYTEAFMAIQIALLVFGLAMVVIYGIIGEKKKYPNTKPTQID